MKTSLFNKYVLPRDKNKGWYIVNLIFMIAILLLVIYGIIDGSFIHNTIERIETCYGQHLIIEVNESLFANLTGEIIV